MCLHHEVRLLVAMQNKITPSATPNPSRTEYRDKQLVSSRGYSTATTASATEPENVGRSLCFQFRVDPQITNIIINTTTLFLSSLVTYRQSNNKTCTVNLTHIVSSHTRSTRPQPINHLPPDKWDQTALVPRCPSWPNPPRLPHKKLNWTKLSGGPHNTLPPLAGTLRPTPFCITSGNPPSLTDSAITTLCGRKPNSTLPLPRYYIPEKHWRRG